MFGDMSVRLFQNRLAVDASFSQQAKIVEYLARRNLRCGLGATSRINHDKLAHRFDKDMEASESRMPFKSRLSKRTPKDSGLSGSH